MMVRSLKVKIISLVLLTYMTTGSVSKIFGDEACQPVTPEGHLRPEVPHVTLTEDYLNGFNEIIIIGDQHGCFDEEQLLINRHQLNDTVLKIFTGDLTRKGNKNLEVVRFIKNCTSCISVRGNNDEKTLLRIWAKQQMKDYEYADEDKWMANLTADEVNWLRNLPYSFYLPSMNARVCHGGFLPGGVPIEDNRPYTIMNIRTVIADPKCPGGWRPTREEFLDSVQAPTYPWASQWRGPEHIYFGHDHKRQLQLYPFATGVDTACVRGHYMTGIFIKGPRNGTFATQPALKKYYHGKV
ncbi:bis(5'-nucleosyl)-tetraphosphatase, symmetrical-like [Argiope bruennichi]|uniref:Bis(5'-nucleosyl)-tetraphosphatase like protein n=1 Tax=Argiope bruennichi TaxID=94029 RepID=A0A8T0F7V0_ARGBR|nr:bis(5'-nucleosyl)-tetraphosphatase, symmetrical-like [Argiope bruennichi]KAF8787266.1 Bis(5'-nucleosyl)-tetraphosphatase like protein [Argiope bruennichi]